VLEVRSDPESELLGSAIATRLRRSAAKLDAERGDAVARAAQHRKRMQREARPDFRIERIS